MTRFLDHRKERTHTEHGLERKSKVILSLSNHQILHFQSEYLLANNLLHNHISSLSWMPP